MARFTSCAVLLACAVLLGSLSAAGALADAPVVVRLDGAGLPSNMTQNHAQAEMVESRGKWVMKVHFDRTDWPNVSFKAPDGVWDWSKYGGIEFDIYNPGTIATQVSLRADNVDAQGGEISVTASATAFPGRWTTHRTYLTSADRDWLWGMNGLPVRGAVNLVPKSFDPSRVKVFQIFLALPQRDCTLMLGNVRLFEKEQPLSERVSLPFVDRFGQYKHATWAGKLSTEDELASRREAEEKDLARVPALPDRDRFGGWLTGPRLKATGWFRTEKVDGKWWLVDPDGRLFFSVGLDCMGSLESTFIEKREAWYDWLPDRKGQFRQCFSSFEGSKVAEPIGGKGSTFSFYRANLVRKYGQEWESLWRQTACRRLKSWGMNTIGNWAEGGLMAVSTVPFVSSTGLYGDFRRTKGFFDVFDPKFAEAVDGSIARIAKDNAANPLCIGYFVDNELDWGPTLYGGVLSDPVDQPARIAFIADLKAKYGSIEALNKAWKTHAKTWDDLKPSGDGAACRQDKDAFTYKFASQYFRIIREAIRKHAPNQLYLGCRFSIAPRMVVRACVDNVDVVSYNLYYESIERSSWVGDNDLGKPVIVGEFHFGANDRGLFHGGMISAMNQFDRARSFARYVRSVAECPAFVGCHWFQYVDESVTGRFDGENYGIGFVDVTDTPYHEMVVASRKTMNDVYRWHSKAR